MKKIIPLFFYLKDFARFLIAILAFFVGGVALANRPLPYFSSDDMTPFWPAEIKDQKPLPDQAKLTAFKLIDAQAREVSDQSLKNQISLVNFFFTSCPSFCPTMMNSINSFKKKNTSQLGEVQFYSISVDPEKDQPPRLQSYAKSHRLPTEKWSFLTGARAEVLRVGKDMLRADGSRGAQKKPDSFIHTGNIYLIDKTLKVRGIYDTGSGDAMNRLAQDIALLKKEDPAASSH